MFSSLGTNHRCNSLYIYIYIYIERERERERNKRNTVAQEAIQYCELEKYFYEFAFLRKTSKACLGE